MTGEFRRKAHKHKMLKILFKFSRSHKTSTPTKYVYMENDLHLFIWFYLRHITDDSFPHRCKHFNPSELTGRSG